MSSRRLISRHIFAPVCVLAVVAFAGSACGNSSRNTAVTPPASTNVAPTIPASSSGSAHALLPTAIQTSGVLRVASSIGFAPYEFYAADGKTFQGLDIDLANALGTALGVKIQIIDTRYPNIPSAMLAGRADIAMSAFTEEPSAYTTLSFVSYTQSTSGILAASSQNQVKPNEPTSLCGFSLGTVAGETGDMPYVTKTNQQCTAMGKKPITLKTFQRTADILLAIQSGQVDGRSAGEAVGQYTAKTAPGLRFVPNVLQEAPHFDGIGVPKGQEQLLRAIQAGMQALEASGTYKAILVKWNVANEAVSSFDIVPPLS